jgi:hypothetical protein
LVYYGGHDWLSRVAGNLAQTPPNPTLVFNGYWLLQDEHDPAIVVSKNKQFHMDMLNVNNASAHSDYTLTSHYANIGYPAYDASVQYQPTDIVSFDGHYWQTLGTPKGKSPPTYALNAETGAPINAAVAATITRNATSSDGVTTFVSDSSTFSSATTYAVGDAVSYFEGAAYSGITAYTYGAVVTYGGKNWQCMNVSTPCTGVTPVAGAYWTERPLRYYIRTSLWRSDVNAGAYTAATPYALNDSVSHGGFYYVCFAAANACQDSTPANGSTVWSRREATSVNTTRHPSVTFNPATTYSASLPIQLNWTLDVTCGSFTTGNYDIFNRGTTTPTASPCYPDFNIDANWPHTGHGNGFNTWGNGFWAVSTSQSPFTTGAPNNLVGIYSVNLTCLNTDVDGTIDVTQTFNRPILTNTTTEITFDTVAPSVLLSGAHGCTSTLEGTYWKLHDNVVDARYATVGVYYGGMAGNGTQTFGFIADKLSTSGFHIGVQLGNNLGGEMSDSVFNQYGAVGNDIGMLMSPGSYNTLDIKCNDCGGGNNRIGFWNFDGNFYLDQGSNSYNAIDFMSTGFGSFTIEKWRSEGAGIVLKGGEQGLSITDVGNAEVIATRRVVGDVKATPVAGSTLSTSLTQFDTRVYGDTTVTQDYWVTFAGSTSISTRLGRTAYTLATGAPDYSTAVNSLVTAWLGAYAGGTTYTLGQAISYSGNNYVSITNANTGNQPDISPLRWTLMDSLVKDNGFSITGLDHALYPEFESGNAIAASGSATTFVTATDTFIPSALKTADSGATGTIFCGKILQKDYSVIITGNTKNTVTFDTIAAPAYNGGENYALNDEVTDGGFTWRSLIASNIGNATGENAFWTKVADHAPIAGCGLEYRGTTIDQARLRPWSTSYLPQALTGTATAGAATTLTDTSAPATLKFGNINSLAGRVIAQTVPGVYGTATGGSSTTLEDSTQTMVVNRYTGMSLVSRNTGHRYEIASNTATIFTLVSNFAKADQPDSATVQYFVIPDKEVRTIGSNTTSVITVTVAWTSNPGAGTTYYIYPALPAMVSYKDMSVDLTFPTQQINKNDEGAMLEIPNGIGLTLATGPSNCGVRVFIDQVSTATTGKGTVWNWCSLLKVNSVAYTNPVLYAQTKLLLEDASQITIDRPIGPGNIRLTATDLTGSLSVTNSKSSVAASPYASGTLPVTLMRQDNMWVPRIGDTTLDTKYLPNTNSNTETVGNGWRFLWDLDEIVGFGRGHIDIRLTALNNAAYQWSQATWPLDDYQGLPLTSNGADPLIIQPRTVAGHLAGSGNYGAFTGAAAAADSIKGTTQSIGHLAELSEGPLKGGRNLRIGCTFATASTCIAQFVNTVSGFTVSLDGIQSASGSKGLASDTAPAGTSYGLIRRGIERLMVPNGTGLALYSNAHTYINGDLVSYQGYAWKAQGGGGAGTAPPSYTIPPVDSAKWTFDTELTALPMWYIGKGISAASPYTGLIPYTGQIVAIEDLTHAWIQQQPGGNLLPSDRTGRTWTIGQNEPDANYFVGVLETNAEETFWITGKSTTGFTVHSSNASSTATVILLIVR